jgi:spermidine/putrescine transport system permease protein
VRRLGGVPLGDWALRAVAGLVLAVLFAPIAMVVVMSFNKPKGRRNLVWQEFSFDAWKDPFAVEPLVEAMELSLQVAVVSTLVATVLGTMIAVALVRHRFRGSTGVDLFLVLPLTAPEVVIGSSLLTLFLDFGWATGFGTIVLAHVMFQISFVAMTVRARLRGFDWSLEDAAMDLGAPPARTFRRVTLPLMLPGIVAAAMLSFALSLDDYIITLFVSGNESTYPIYVAGVFKAAYPPQISVLATMILVLSLLVIVVGGLWSRWRTKGSLA